MTNSPGAPDSWTTVAVSTVCRLCDREICAMTKGPVSIVRCAGCGTTNRCAQTDSDGRPSESPLFVDASRDDVQWFPSYRGADS